MATVQFFGSDKVLQAYRARGVETWGIFDGKNLMQSGDTEDELSQWLRMLEPGGSQGTYTLKVFRDLTADDVTDKSESNGAFKFKLGESSQAFGVVSRAGTNAGPQSVNDMIAAKIGKIIEADIDDLIDRRINGSKDDDEDSPTNWGKMIMGVLKDPQQLGAVLGVIKGIFNPGTGVANISAPTALAGVRQQPPDITDTMNEQQLEQLQSALDRLGAKDPKLVLHLSQLADLAEKKPGLFNMMLVQLENQ